MRLRRRYEKKLPRAPRDESRCTGRDRGGTERRSSERFAWSELVSPRVEYYLSSAIYDSRPQPREIIGEKKGKSGKEFSTVSIHGFLGFFQGEIARARLANAPRD